MGERTVSKNEKHFDWCWIWKFFWENEIISIFFYFAQMESVKHNKHLLFLFPFRQYFFCIVTVKYDNLFVKKLPTNQFFWSEIMPLVFASSNGDNCIVIAFSIVNYLFFYCNRWKKYFFGLEASLFCRTFCLILGKQMQKSGLWWEQNWLHQLLKQISMKVLIGMVFLVDYV